MDISNIDTLVALAGKRANALSDRTAFTFLQDGEQPSETCSYAELDRAARDIAVNLREHGMAGERVMLLFPPGLDFIRGFFGCLYAGAVATPVYPPQDIRHLDRLQAIIEDCEAKAILTVPGLADLVGAAAATLPALRRLEVLTTGAVNQARADTWSDPGIGADDLAFLQYTSGSTGEPKGVALSHGNLLHNQTLIAAGFRDEVEMVGLNWLPMYHDMGLIGHVVQPLYQGIHNILMSPLDFLKRPGRWLEAISRYGVTTSGGPNFAYELCVRRIAPEQREGLDLSSWTLAYSGAEPVRARTIERFSEAFAPYGFRPEAFYPCYGLAEATLFVSGGRRREQPVISRFNGDQLTGNRAIPVKGPSSGEERSLVGCGQIPESLRVRIVAPDTCEPLADGQVGEIWVQGDSVAGRYWNNPEATEQTFNGRLSGSGEGPYLRTGDLGFLLDGELYLSSRLKDLLIIRGRNHYPQDIEQTVEAAHPSFRAGCCAAFTTDVDGEEQLVVVQEVNTQKFVPAEATTIVTEVSQRVAKEHGIHLYELVLVEPRTLPKTSSGKIRRSACREQWQSDHLKVIHKGEATQGGGEALERLPGEAPLGDIETKLAGMWKDILGVSSVARDDNFFHLGADSIKSVELAYALEEGFGLNLPAAVFYEYPTLRTMAEAIAADGKITRISNLPDQVVLDPEIQPPTPAPTHCEYKRVFLTGATGFLGTFLLHDLLNNTDATVYCLVRAGSEREGMERLEEAFRRVELEPTGFGERVRVVVGELSEYRLGLGADAFEALAGEIDSIIHCGAMVDWVRPYRDLYGPNVVATHEVLRLAGTKTTKPVHYISTLWVFTPDRKKRGQIWWEHEDNPDWRTLETGYNQSKWVAEQLVYEAMRRGFPTAVYRMDFIIGLSTNGIMKVTDFVPRIVRDVVELGCLPMEKVAVDLIPGDFLSRMIMALARWPDAIGKTFHLSNPDRLTVDSLTEMLTEFGYAIERVPLDEWKRRVGSRTENALYPLRDFLSMYDAEFIDISDQAKIDTTVSVKSLAAAAPGLVASIPPMRDLVFHMLDYLYEQKLISKPPQRSA
ncbi:thioester reductase domain-containing protein [Haliangium ochraceum]|uniref:Thioester reductase domain protein n=1 Tax=Haliangium ochraceum (strain DSM 14365 / JCM 11303 / SMP-2) TaxID=502025 RepID=D0LLE9_HALO1|nr:thioester reductase domain-containing protein [Haliangium ochraceum]ACY18645.1 thioester reductase domain protein [Haliangium ochraceum DSM 14365]